MSEGKAKVTLNPCQGFGCHEHCILEVHSDGEKVTRTQRAKLPGPHPGCRICAKGATAMDTIYADDKLKYPMKRKPGTERGAEQWERISWEQAFDEIGEIINRNKEKYGSRSIIMNKFWCGVPAADRSTEHDLAMAFADTLGATILEGPSVDMGLIYGSLTDQGGLISNSKYLLNDCDDEIIIWGSNPIGFTRPGETTHMLMDARDRGCRLVHISNLYDVTSAKVDQWVPVKSGTDAALALAMAKVIVDRGLYDKETLFDRTTSAYLVRDDNGQYLRWADVIEGGSPAEYVFIAESDGKPRSAARDVGRVATGAIGSEASQMFAGASDEVKVDVYQGETPVLEIACEVNGIPCKTVFTRLREHLEKWTPESQEELTGVPAQTCIDLAVDYATRERCTIFVNNGFRYANGQQTSRAVYLLTYLTGKLGKKGSTLLPSPMDYPPQSSINIMPIWFPNNDTSSSDQETFPRIMESFSNPDMQQYKVLINAFSNPLLNWPNKHMWQEEVLPNLECFVVMEIRYSDTCKYADYVLPEASIYERWELMSGPNDCITLCEPAIEPVGECLDAAEIYRGLGKRVGNGEFFQNSMYDWIDYKLTLSESFAPIMAKITEEEDPERAGELAPVTMERLKKVKTLRIDGPEETPDNFTSNTFETASGKIEYYVEGLAPLGKQFADYETCIIHDDPSREQYPLQFYPGRHKYFMQSQYTNVREMFKLASATQTGVAMNPDEAAKRGLHDGDDVEVFNQRGLIKVKLSLRPDIPMGMAHMWYSFKEDFYPDSDCPETLESPLCHPSRQSDIMYAVSLGAKAVLDAQGVPRAARFIIEKSTPEVFWDSLCEVKKAEA